MLLAVALFSPACSDIDPPNYESSLRDEDNSVYLDWNGLLLELDRYATGYRPGPASRTAGYLGLAAYEAVVTAMPDHNSIAPFLPGLSVPQPAAREAYHWPTVVNELYAYLMRRFFFHLEVNRPDVYARIEQLRMQRNDAVQGRITPQVFERSVAYGQRVGQAVYDWSATDLVAHNAFLNPAPADYAPPAGQGLWKPTAPDFSRALFPEWGEARTFALPASERLCRPPLPYSQLPSSLYYAQHLEVYNTVQHMRESNDAVAIDDRWKSIFWSDDITGLTFSPSIRMVAVLNQLVQREKLNMAECAELYAKMGMALNDACVSIWHSKYFYNTERPVDYIRTVVAQQFPSASTWTTFLNNPIAGVNGINPAFPAYPSGHSGFAGAGGVILSSFFEFNSKYPGTYRFTDFIHEGRTEFNGTPRSFTSIRQMVEEKAFARIALGVHVRMDCLEGIRVGEHAAQRVLELPWKK